MRAPQLLWTNAVIAAAAAACTMRTLILVGSDVTNGHSAAFSIGIGGAAWLAYTWQRHVKSTRLNGLRPDHLLWHQNHWKTLKKAAWIATNIALAPLALTLAVIKTAPIEVHPILFLAFAAALFTTIMYAGLPGEFGKRFALRRIPGMKMIWVALSWTIITAAWPAWWSGAMGTLDSQEWAAILMERFFVIVALTLPFDLRDRQWDPPAMKNWTRTLGQRGTPFLAAVCLLVAVAGLWFTENAAREMALVGALPMMVAVLMAKESRSEGYFGWLDGLLILDGLCLWIWAL